MRAIAGHLDVMPLPLVRCLQIIFVVNLHGPQGVLLYLEDVPVDLEVTRMKIVVDICNHWPFGYVPLIVVVDYLVSARSEQERYSSCYCLL
jgi:hypothetical protein